MDYYLLHLEKDKTDQFEEVIDNTIYMSDIEHALTKRLSQNSIGL